MSPRRGEDWLLVPAEIACPAPRLLLTLFWKMVLSLAGPIVATSARATARAVDSAAMNPRKTRRSIFLPSGSPIIPHMFGWGGDIATCLKRPAHAQDIAQIIVGRAGGRLI